MCWGAEEVVEEEMAVAVSRVAFFAPTEQLPLERAQREQASERERERESESDSERERERDELEGSLALDGARVSVATTALALERAERESERAPGSGERSSYNNHTSTRERRHASSTSYYGSILRLY
jgi:septal ring factor EnvC (AmiA/AmiB activator)